MWLIFYKQLSQRLIEKTQWDVNEPTDRLLLPEIKIYFGYKENTNSVEYKRRNHYTVKLLTNITKNHKKKQIFSYYMPQNFEDSIQVKYIHILEDSPYSGYSLGYDFSITRNFNIEETTNLEILSNKIIEEIPFKSADQNPKYFGSILP